MIDIEGPSQPYHESERFAFLTSSADKYFSRISPYMENSHVLLTTIQNQGLSDYMRDRLPYEERKSLNPWTDIELQERLQQEIEVGSILAPTDTVEYDRWLGLVCIAFAQQTRFSYGNILLFADVLPEDSEEFEEYADMYGWCVLDDIVRRRNALRNPSIELKE